MAFTALFTLLEYNLFVYLFVYFAGLRYLKNNFYSIMASAVVNAPAVDNCLPDEHGHHFVNTGRTGRRNAVVLETKIVISSADLPKDDNGNVGSKDEENEKKTEP